MVADDRVRPVTLQLLTQEHDFAFERAALERALDD
jgi:hypothetical protein